VSEAPIAAEPQGASNLIEGPAALDADTDSDPSGPSDPADAQGSGRPARTGLRRAIATLEAEGARVFDGPGVGLIESLIDRAAGLEGAARERLEARAAARLESLTARFAAERERAAAVLELLVEQGGDPSGRLARALEEGDLLRILRAGRRHLVGSEQDASAPAPRARPERSYREALTDLMASLSAATLEDSPPEQAGLLNGTLLAARILEAAEALSPAYRRVLVSRLIDLGPLLHLPAVPSPRKRS
jgi:hypothetical protein